MERFGLNLLQRAKSSPAWRYWMPFKRVPLNAATPPATTTSEKIQPLPLGRPCHSACLPNSKTLGFITAAATRT